MKPLDKTTLYTNTLHDKHQALMQIINRYDTNMNQLDDAIEQFFVDDNVRKIIKTRTI